MHVIIASGSASAQGSGWQLLVSCHAALPLRCQGSIHEAAIRCTGENATLRQQERLVLPRLCAVGVVKIGRQHVSWCSVLLQLLTFPSARSDLSAGEASWGNVHLLSAELQGPETKLCLSN